MITKTQNIKECHPNGKLWIDEQRCYVHPASVGLYNGLVKSESDGRFFFRISVTKYFDNGQFAWKISKNNSGDIINKNDSHFRKDGSRVY